MKKLKIRDGREEDIRECIGCNICAAADNRSVPIRCTQNPTMVNIHWILDLIVFFWFFPHFYVFYLFYLLFVFFAKNNELIHSIWPDRVKNIVEDGILKLFQLVARTIRFSWLVLVLPASNALWLCLAAATLWRWRTNAANSAGVCIAKRHSRRSPSGVVSLRGACRNSPNSRTIRFRSSRRPKSLHSTRWKSELSTSS